jgi:hypothetical protein
LSNCSNTAPGGRGNISTLVTNPSLKGGASFRFMRATPSKSNATATRLKARRKIKTPRVVFDIPLSSCAQINARGVPTSHHRLGLRHDSTIAQA